MAAQSDSWSDQPPGRPPARATVHCYRNGLAAARRAATGYARASGLAEERIQDVVLAIGELTANTLRHTSGPGTLTMWTADGELLAQVDDAGHIRAPLPGPDRPGLTGGQGLWLVGQLCDRVDIRTGPGGTSIRIHVRLTP